MKTLALSMWGAAAAIALTASLHSQTAVPKTEAAPPKTSIEAVQALRAANAALLEKQTATLLKLDELAKEVAQIKILSKRS